MLHCLGVLLDCPRDDPYAHIKDMHSLISNLVGGLQFPCEDIRGEILFVLYKLSTLQTTSAEGDKLLYFLGDALIKAQNVDVLLNCVEAYTYDSSSMNFPGEGHSS